MSARLRRVLGAVVVSVGLVGSAAGCGVDGTPVVAGGVNPGGSSTGDVSSTADPTRVHELVLDAAVFPAGYTAQVVPSDQMQQMMDMVLASTKSADVSPSHCMQLSAIPSSVNVNDIGLVIATKGGVSSLAESVIVTASSIDEYRAQVSGDCEHLTMDMTVEGQSVKATAEQKVVAGPTTRADDTLVVEMTTVSRVGSQSITQRVIVGYAQVAGYTLSVQASSMDPSGTPDRAGFDDVFTKAIDKAVDEA
ncbi:hypothetical protein L5G28_02070 [Gordonia sp. HY285]|uniref:hypothetical protein n=1 Tax=Gordonia liuliyuniae TaxID=2911517 RepID=UPI001F1CF008|nr:hypothetical protein [Gordonia liuliyuniae]MCF8608952.1 hypothetical protein [Gordonia liuliyuniae]